MTKALAPGLGIAEDPGEGNSFGLHRCGLIAEGLLRAREAGQASPSRRLATVIDCLEQRTSTSPLRTKSGELRRLPVAAGAAGATFRAEPADRQP